MNKSIQSISEQKGFSLIELMVGMTIGLIVTLVVSQVFGTFEGQQRTTSGTADAQTNGSIALFSMSRDLQMAGYGLMASNDDHSPLECTSVTLGADAISSGAMTAAAGINNLSPVIIADGVPSDTVTVRYGDSLLGGIPTTLTSPPNGQVLEVGSNLNCKGGDFAVITRNTACAVAHLADPQNTPTTNSVTELVIDAGETVPAIATAGGSNISCLGNWRVKTFDVNNGVLRLNGDDLIAGVVSVQAQYGVSASATNNAVTQWVDPTGTWAAGTLSVANRNRIKAIRIAVVARNAKLEQQQVSKACNTAGTFAEVCLWGGTTAVDLSATANWDQYRYRVFETIVPLRNIIWSRETL